ncbi:nuclease-related domain-containing protein [Salibacterium salarium]|uniref:nuclease-related domain-containing protein n=1 Tax=Salibacterium salarium TaxID=284579 RepID=UPI0036D22A94
MIIKPRTMPLILQKLKILERRLPAHHPAFSDIKRDAARWTAGYKGEKSIDYPLTFLPAKDCFILHDIRLYDGTHFFQMDTIILSPVCLFILEVKNMAGTLIFDPNFNQFIRKYEEKEEAFQHPLIQVNRHRSQLMNWLVSYGHAPLPIETLVVIGNTHSVLKKTNRNDTIHEKVVHSPLLPNKIFQLMDQYKTNSVAKVQLKTISDALKRSHMESNEDILKRHHIKRLEVLSGVICPSCFSRPMERKHGRWKCSHCNHLSKTAHLEALDDYSLLFSSFISNRQAQQFLHISSEDVTKRLLKSLNTTHKGENRGRKYLIPRYRR